MMSFYAYLKIGSSRIRIKNLSHILTSAPIFFENSKSFQNGARTSRNRVGFQKLGLLPNAHP
jgi:hypothetical protein